MAKFNIKTVLVSPLDWGLGHATRCIPIIKALLQNNYTVIIACNATQKLLFNKEFLNVQFIHINGYNIEYARKKWLFPVKLLFQINKINTAIKTEQVWLNETIHQHKIDLVISDNRYGLYTTKIPCIFITHQLLVKAPFHWLEIAIQKKLYQYIQQFSAVWVPDFYANNNIGGKLSHPVKKPHIPIHYIGMLSRFQQISNIKHVYAYCILISGPEPQRTIIEELIFKQIENITQPVVFIRGLPNSTSVLNTNNSHITIYNHLEGNALSTIIQSSEYIVCRSGYTSLMELFHLQKKIILIPTPGQTEQEYLAKTLHEKKLALSVPQAHFNFNKAVEIANAFSYQQANVSFSQLQLSAQIHSLIQQL